MCCANEFTVLITVIVFCIKGEAQNAIYRNEDDKFPEEVLKATPFFSIIQLPSHDLIEMYNNENLLDINAKNPGDYGRRLLHILFTEQELKTSRLPSTVAGRFSKPKLDEARFSLLNDKLQLIPVYYS